jgi:two-component system nitrogen regulation sensor histidine kinase GlnL
MVSDLFKPFATTKPHGTGLGLVSVRECALAHGGRVEYARSPLGGAAFSVCLPAAVKEPIG